MTDIEKITEELGNYDKTRVIKYLQIKSGIKSKNIKNMVKSLISKKKIKNNEEFMMRLKISDYTFMTAPMRVEFINKIHALEY